MHLLTAMMHQEAFPSTETLWTLALIIRLSHLLKNLLFAQPSRGGEGLSLQIARHYIMHLVIILKQSSTPRQSEAETLSPTLTLSTPCIRL
jgi:hypothetical protein